MSLTKILVERRLIHFRDTESRNHGNIGNIKIAADGRL